MLQYTLQALVHPGVFVAWARSNMLDSWRALFSVGSVGTVFADACEQNQHFSLQQLLL
jgi:hypothetical protein